MMEAYEETGGNIIAVEEVPEAKSRPMASSARGDGPDNGFRITGMVEKPKREDAPSNLIISGRYILQPEIFNLLADQPRGAGGEIQLTDAMQTLMQQQPFTGVKYEGQSLRLRLQDRLPHRQCRLRARPRPTSPTISAAK